MENESCEKNSFDLIVLLILVSLIDIKSSNEMVSKINVFTYRYHTYQSPSCATAINTKFSELFSRKRIFAKYKNAILSDVGRSFQTWKD